MDPQTLVYGFYVLIAANYKHIVMSNESYGIRHGESEANVGGTAKDPHSTNLTPKGEAQSERVANEIKYLGIQSALIISSPFLRAKQRPLNLSAKIAEL